jgi:hypothetical protein
VVLSKLGLGVLQHRPAVSWEGAKTSAERTSLTGYVQLLH